MTSRVCAPAVSTPPTSLHGATYASLFSYNPAGQVTGFNYGNGVAATFGYSDERLQLTTLKYMKGATKLLDLAYSYTQNDGNNGQITGITDNTGTQEGGRTASYAYDALGRLREAQTAGSTTYPKWHYLYTYDRYGNLTAKTLQPDSVGTHPTLSITVSATTNRITSSGFSYDAAGNMTNDAMNTYTYDAENRIKTGAGATYTYDGAGLRVKKVAGGTTTRYIFSGSKVVAEYVGTTPVPSSPTREYIYSGSALLAAIEGGTTTYHHQDHLSVRVNTNTAGTLVGQQGHYPFGQLWYASGTSTKWQFSSYERDAESTLDYAVFRYDSSRLGRFLTPDPIAGSILNPQSLNRYAYVLNNPVNLIDPLGLEEGYTFLIPGGVSWIGEDCILDGIYVNCQLAEQAFSTGEASFASAPPGWRPHTHPEYAGCFVSNDHTWCPGDPGGLPSPFGPGTGVTADASGGSRRGRGGRTIEDRAECVRKALNQQLGVPFERVDGIDPFELGGHANAVFRTTLSESQFSSFVDSLAPGVGRYDGLRFDISPSLHIVPGGLTFIEPLSSDRYLVQAQAHLDQVNPNTGDARGVVGHAMVDGLGGTIVQLFGGNIDPKCH